MKNNKPKVTLNANGQPRKSGSGRPKNSVSLVNVTFSDLAKRFKGEDSVVIGRVFWEGIIGAKLIVTTPSVAKTQEPVVPEVQKAEEKIDLSSVAQLIVD